MEPNTTSAIRDIFVIVAAGVFAALCLVLMALALKLYRPLRDAARNSAEATGNLRKISGDLAGVSEETANNILITSRNAVNITDNLKQGSEEVPGVVHAAGEAARSAAEAAGTGATIAENVMRITSLGLTGGASSPVGAMLRFVRSMFGGRRGSEEGGIHDGA